MINKIAQPPYWPKVVQKVKTLGLRPEIVSMLNNFNQIVWDASPPSSNPNALAYVSSEDLDSDGKIDKIHFVLNKFPPNASEEEIDGIVGQVARTLVHEYGHIQDFDADKVTFPGGEGAAESAERAAEGMINQRLESFSKINTTNKKIGIDNVIKRSSIGEYKMKKELVKLANHLDNIGHRDLADKLDNVIRKTADSGLMPNAGEPANMEEALKGLEAINKLTPLTTVRQVDAEIRNWLSANAFLPENHKQFVSWVNANLKTEGGRQFSQEVGRLFKMQQGRKSQPGLVESSPPTQAAEAVAKSVVMPTEQAAAKQPARTEQRQEQIERRRAAGEATPFADMAEKANQADDFVSAANSTQDRIDKLAELMSREFTTNVPGTFSR